MIYFDSAATTLQKPAAVRRAVSRALVGLASPGRGGHRAGMAAADTVYRARETAAELFGAPGPEGVVFTMNATHGLNLAMKSLVGAGDRVVVSGYEHNSVIRPLHAIGAEVVVARSPLFAPEMAVAAFAAAVTPDTKLVVCNHVSNVFGYVLPVVEIGALCRERGVPFVLDASQSAGLLEVDTKALGAAFVAMPGHKGLYGPQGTGILICNTHTVSPLLEGGTGSDSMRREMPEDLPDRLEAGTPNMPGISGLLAGMEFIRRRGMEQMLRHERHLLRCLLAGLRRISGVCPYAAEDPEQQAGVLSFHADGTDCEAVAEALGTADIAVRAGLHCSPLAHETAGTQQTGTVRVSFSVFNTEAEVTQFLGVLEQIIKRLRK